MHTQAFRYRKMFFSGILFILALFPFVASANITLGTANTSALSSGLVGYWPLDGNTTNWSTGTTYDLSGQGNNGSLIGLSTTTSPAQGKIGQGFKFVRNTVSASQYVKAADASSLDITGSDSFTISFWLKPTVVCDSVNNQNYIEKAQDSVTPGWGIYMSTTCTLNARLVYSGARVDVGVSSANTAANFATSTWTQVILVGNRSTNLAQWYLNGRAVGSSVSISALGDMSNGNGLEIGSGIHGLGVNTIGGTMDDVRVYKRAFSNTEVALLYASGQARVGSSARNALTSGLVGYWTMDGADIGNSFKDTSGNGYNGYLVGTNNATSSRKTIGKVGQGFTFGGLNTGSINLGSSTALDPNRFTIAGWIYVNTPQTYTYNYLYSNARDCCSVYNGIEFRVNGAGALAGGIWNSSQTTIVSSSGLIATSTWTHVAFSYDGSNMRLYKDGKLIKTQAQTTDPGSPASFNTYIGSMGNGNGVVYTLDGKMDDWRLYNRALSDSEVAQMYTSAAVHVGQSSTASNSSGLVGYWTFDGPNMNWKTGKALDSSGNGNDGVLVNVGTTTAPTIGKVGQALQFNGSNSYVSVPNSSSLNPTNLTASVWAKSNVSTWNNYGFLLSKRDVYIIHPTQSGTVVNFYINNGSWVSVGCTPTTAITSWNMYTMTWDGTTLRCYINGVAGGSSTPGGSINTSDTGELDIGKDDGQSRYFNGSEDEVRLYNRALSASEVRQLYKGGR